MGNWADRTFGAKGGRDTAMGFSSADHATGGRCYPEPLRFSFPMLARARALVARLKGH